MGQQLVALLGGRIQRNRIVHLVLDGIGHLLVGAVDAGGRGIHQMLHRMIPAGLQNIIKTDDIALDVHIGIGNGIPDTGLGCQIHHHMEAVLCKAVVNALSVGNAAPDKFPSGAGMQCSFLFNFPKSPFLDGHIVIIIDIIKAHNGYTRQGLQQLQHQVGADKAGSAGNQNGFIV